MVLTARQRSYAPIPLGYDSNADTRTDARNQPIAGSKLYNLAADIGEKNDLYAAMPGKAKELQDKWDAWNSTLMKPLWGHGKSDSDGDPKAPKKKKKKK